jgi:glucans biosynthesis protein
MTSSIRAFIAAAGLLLSLGGSGCAAAEAASPFGIEQVAARARTLAAEPYRDRRREVPAWMMVGETTYDQWRDIRFRPDASLWRDDELPFQVQFFHPGLYYGRSIAVNVVEKGTARAVPFSRRLFDYGKNDFADRIPDDIGYAGFRIHSPIKSPEYFDELIVFLGASYFRAVGRDHVYGLSARGLAIDTVTAVAEEFPNFTEFWLVEPSRDAREMVIYALLDGPSVTGAYAFTVTPGEQTRVDVEARLFFRRSVDRLGIAPLTSMYFFGENSRRRFDDFRPEVHDSDGLLLHSGEGEWLWRPLENPRTITVNAFATTNPRGFGLLQRDRDFASHQDLETRAERRPSAWIVPQGDWGKGAVELVQIPTDTELNDNIVAFWRPADVPGPGDSRTFAYSLFWQGNDPALPPGGRAVATRQDAGTLEGGRRFVVDFAGGSLASDGPDTVLQAVVDGSGGSIEDVHLTWNDAIGGWRLGFQVKPAATTPVELRAYLARGADVLTETWTYTHLPAE